MSLAAGATQNKKPRNGESRKHSLPYESGRYMRAAAILWIVLRRDAAEWSSIYPGGRREKVSTRSPKQPTTDKVSTYREGVTRHREAHLID